MQGFVRRAKGAHSVRQPSLRVRNGSTATVFLGVNPSLSPLDAIFIGNQGGLIATPTDIYDASTLSSTPIFSGTIYDRPVVSRAPFDEGLSENFGVFLTIPQTAFTVLQRRVTSTGLVPWGIAKPGSGPTAADGGAGALPAGTYKYKVTFVNTATGTESNPHDAEVSVTIGASRQISLTNIPTSSDTQVNQRRIYRTSAGGALYFFLTQINDNSTTSLTDNITTLQSDLIKFDNDPPEDTYRFHWWSHTTNRMWWCNNRTLSSIGLNRVFYSGAGRPESVSGFVNIGGTDTPLVGLEWRERNWVFGYEGVWRIDGQTEPFQPTILNDVPGIHLDGRDTVVATPYGIFYRSNDENVYLFNGQQAIPVGLEVIEAISKFRDPTQSSTQNVEGLAPSGWKTAHFFRNELFISDGAYQAQSTTVDGSETIAYHIPSKAFRTLGFGVKAFDHDRQDNLFASFNGNVARLESTASLPVGTSGQLTDLGQGIPFEWEVGGHLSDISQNAILQRVYLDINTRGVAVTPQIIFENDDTNPVTFSTLSTTSRQMVEFNVGRTCRVFSVRLSGDANAVVELYGVEADVYIPGSDPSPGRG